MLFENKTGTAVKVKNSSTYPPTWKTIKVGEQIELEETHGKNLGFIPVEIGKPKAVEGKINNVPVETKVLETLDDKDAVNMLDQNARTIFSNIEKAKLGKQDLSKLIETEKKGKNRIGVISFLKEKLEA